MDPKLILLSCSDQQALAEISGSLHRGGYATVHKDTAVESLKLATSRPDQIKCIIVALDLPDLSGEDLVHALQAQSRLPRLPILRISAEGSGLKEEIASLNAGADHHLSLPLHPEQFLSVIHTLVRQRRYESDVLRSLRKAEDITRRSQRLEAIGQLAGGVAHDFNNLLMVILSFAQLLEQQAGIDEVGRRHLAQIVDATGRGALITRQLLAFGRKQTLNLERVCVESLLAENRSMLRHALPENVSLVVNCSTDSHIHVDTTQILQVILNLLLNARDAMPNGGAVSITAEAARDDDYSRFDLPDGPFVALRVTDNGTGISPENMQHLFEPFFTTKQLGGTGLGLAVAYGIIKQSDGFIYAESKAGEGTTFNIFLPAVTEHTVIEEPVVVRGRRVLVVEDEPLLREVTVETLEAHGFETASAASGHEAIKIVEQMEEPPHILLTDVVMPELDGRELALRLKQRNPELVVIFMSGYSQTASVPGILLQKPFPMSRLLELLKELENPSS